MLAGGGKIVFAHVEEVIDFPNIEGVQKYVKWHEDNNKTIYYVKYLDNGKFEISPKFNEDEHLKVTGAIDRPYTITVWIPYNGMNMGN